MLNHDLRFDLPRAAAPRRCCRAQLHRVVALCFMRGRAGSRRCVPRRSAYTAWWRYVLCVAELVAGAACLGVALQHRLSSCSISFVAFLFPLFRIFE
jgi:hypothetical protein